MLLTYLAPVSYTVMLWLFFNRTIMGDALFFLRSSYGNTSQTSGVRDAGSYLQGVVHSLPGALLYAGERLLGVFPVFGVVLLAAVAALMAKREWRVLCIGALVLSVPAFHVLLLFSGGSFGWLRFFMYGIPGTFLLAPFVLPALTFARQSDLGVASRALLQRG